MAFNFSLAAVLALRQQREQQEERALTAILHELTGAHETVGRIEAELRNVHAARSHTALERLQAISLHEHYARVNVLEQGRAELLLRIAELEAQRSVQQQIYLVARSDRDLLDELKTRQRAGFTAEATRRDQKRMDDLFLARRLRS